ncbi:hypothetical protein Rhopal_007127-T1 [Rhodotorula paludigena]|uniref:AAA+ ATPase domain-containing protein n=1 Tax=Rhodotorula paludigena TaxID=86838 RepID=A0AAV5GUX3_9BASI|nr:hypothetical protein Rhopal_007127-T1 [Rhodotorula paludigena]
MGKSSKDTSKSPAPLRQFSISSFLPRALPASTSSQANKPVKKRAKDDSADELNEDDLDEDEFKRPPTPKRAKGKARSKQLTVLDLTADDDDVDLASSSPPPAPKGKDRKGKGKALAQDLCDEKGDHEADLTSTEELWVDKYAPRDRDDLALHAKKLSDVESWFLEAFALEGRPKHLAKYRRVLVLSGPAGAGKTAALRILAKEKDVEIVEWREGTNVELAEECMAPALDFGPDPLDLSTASSSSAPSSSRSAQPLSAHTRRLILLEDLPNISHWPTRLALRSALQQYLTSPRVSCPLILVVSEALARPGSDEGGAAGWIGGSGRRGESVDARSVCGVEVLQHPACREIVFNPIAKTIMRKALVRTLDRIYPPSTSTTSRSKSSKSKSAPASSAPSAPDPSTRPSLATLDLLIEHSSGDIRSALMSLQFLTTQGGGDATSLGLGAKGSGKGAKDRKKRKRGGESSDEDDGGGKAGGKDRVKKLLQFVTARESSLFIFHALGKVLYNKRWGESADDDKKDLGRPGIVQERESDKLPRHLRKEWDRKPSKVDPDAVFAEAPINADIFLSYLHHNYPPFTNEIDECVGIGEALSAADAVMSGKSEGEEAYRRLPLTSLYGFQLSVRSTLLSLPSPVPRRKQVLRKSELWESLRLQRQNEDDADEVLALEARRAVHAVAQEEGEVAAKRGVLGEVGEKRKVLQEVVPWLGVIKPVAVSPFLLDLATFPPLDSAAQGGVTGAALGEKDANADEDEVDVGEGPTESVAVDLSEPRGMKRARVLEEVDEERDDAEAGEAALLGAPQGTQGGRGRKKDEMLYDPDDDIVD